MIAFVAVPLLAFRKQSELTGCYLPAADRIVQGLGLPGPERWVYPPAFTVPVLPLVTLPVPLSRLAWALVTVTCTILGVRAIWNSAMQDRGFAQAVKRPVLFVGFVLGLAVTSVGHAVVPLSYQSHDPLVFALLGAAAWVQAARPAGDPIGESRAGALLGLAASFKVMPVIFLPTLMTARRWRAAVAMGVTGVVVVIGFDVASTALTGKAHFVDWLAGRPGWDREAQT